MTEREKVLLRREGAARALLITGREWCSADANTEAARLFPLPTRTVPIVRQGPSGRWYRCVVCGIHRWVMSYGNKYDASMDRARIVPTWPAEDQPTVAALLALPLTEQVEDTGEDGAK